MIDIAVRWTAERLRKIDPAGVTPMRLLPFFAWLHFCIAARGAGWPRDLCGHAAQLCHGDGHGTERGSGISPTIAACDLGRRMN